MSRAEKLIVINCQQVTRIKRKRNNEAASYVLYHISDNDNFIMLLLGFNFRHNETLSGEDASSIILKHFQRGTFGQCTSLLGRSLHTTVD